MIPTFTNQTYTLRCFTHHEEHLSAVAMWQQKEPQYRRECDFVVETLAVKFKKCWVNFDVVSASTIRNKKHAVNINTSKSSTNQFALQFNAVDSFNTIRESIIHLSKPIYGTLLAYKRNSTSCWPRH